MEGNGNLTKFDNGTSSSPQQVESDETGFRVTKIFFYFLILSASTFGNSMVAHIITSTRKMRTASNYLILNLAICDLLTPAISIVSDFILEENNYVWLYGRVMCKLLWPAQTYFTCASSLTLAVISLDRYRLIMHPFKTRLSTKQICFLILFVHVFCLIAVSPYVYALSVKGGSCEEDWPEFEYRQAYTLFLFLVQYGLPLIFMAVVYGLAVHALYNTSARMRVNSINSKTLPPVQSKVSKDSENMSQRKDSRRHVQSVMKKINDVRAKIDIWKTPNAKAMQMFIVIVLVFATFMFPNQVVWLWADFGDGISNLNFANISIICWLFTYTNCVVNPIIFSIFSNDFHRGFKTIFKSMITCFKTPSEVNGVNGERKRLGSCNKTASEYLSGGESLGTDCQRCSLLVATQAGQQKTHLDLQGNKHSRSSSLEQSFSDYEFDQTITSRLENSMPKGKILPVIPGELSDMMTSFLSRRHLKDALNSLPETDC